MTFKNLYVLAILLIFIAFAAIDGHAQKKRDHLTKEEVDLVRSVQAVDQRMEVFTIAIERRMWVLNGIDQLNKKQKKQLKKDVKQWGELPTGTKTELYSDIGKILNESIDKFEDVFEHDPKSKLIPRAFYVLADYSEELIPRLKAIADKTTDRLDLSLLDIAASDCAQILQARDKIPRPSGKQKKKD
jgi:predicted RNA-binding protein YlxR (DUF448 family)